MPTSNKLVGLIPAGGSAARIAPLPCSKEIFPIGLKTISDTGTRSKAVCEYLLEKMKIAGVDNVFIVIRKDKPDIPGYLGDGSEFGLNLAYLIMRNPNGAPFTLNQAYHFIKDDNIAFGFADIIFQPDDAYNRLIHHQIKSDAEIILGVFPATNPSIMDMVDLDKSGRVRSIEIKPHKTNLQYTWLIAVWTPVFTQFMHEYLLKSNTELSGSGKGKELHVGDVIQAAIDKGLHVGSVMFPDADYLDIGTPDNLEKAIQKFS